MLPGDEVLVAHPYIGSIWGVLLEVKKVDGRDWVVFEYLDTSDVGSAYLPDDYMGEFAVMNFPAICVRKHIPNIRREEDCTCTNKAEACAACKALSPPLEETF